MKTALALLAALTLFMIAPIQPQAHAACTLSDLNFQQQALSWFEGQIAPDLNQVNCYISDYLSGTCAPAGHTARQYDCATTAIGQPPPTNSTPRYWRFKDGISCSWNANHIQDMHAQIYNKPTGSWQFLYNVYCSCSSTVVSCQYVF